MENLKALKEVDLTQDCVEKINQLIKLILPLPIMATQYHKGKVFDRAMKIRENEVDFDTKSRLSYAPAKYNTNYLRASTPQSSMFYGSVLKDNYTTDEHGYARITACCETSELLRDNSIPRGERLMFIGSWEVQETITLATIIDPAKEYEIDYLQGIKNKYMERLKQDPEYGVKGAEYLRFLAEEFSKNVKDGDNHEYHISALFSALMVRKGYDGVLYPSVRAAGIGLCVAIHPSIADKLKLISVRKCLLKKEDGQIKITYLKAQDVEDDSKPFKLLDIEEYNKQFELNNNIA